jgi:hypothetical protein
MQKERVSRLGRITLILSVLLLFTGGAVFAAADEQVKREVFTKSISGEVSGISKNFIAVVYGQNDKESLELALQMDKSTKGSQRKLSEIKVGDIVSVTYEEVVETKKGEQPKVIRRLAKVVEFRRAAAVAPEEGSALESQ